MRYVILRQRFIAMLDSSLGNCHSILGQSCFIYLFCTDGCTRIGKIEGNSLIQGD